MGNFWGPKMSALLDECDRRGIEWEVMSPPAFRQAMEDATGVSVPEYSRHEDAAAKWLEAWGISPAAD